MTAFPSIHFGIPSSISSAIEVAIPSFFLRTRIAPEPNVLPSFSNCRVERVAPRLQVTGIDTRLTRVRLNSTYGKQAQTRLAKKRPASDGTTQDLPVTLKSNGDADKLYLERYGARPFCTGNGCHTRTPRGFRQLKLKLRADWHPK